MLEKVKCQLIIFDFELQIASMKKIFDVLNMGLNWLKINDN